MIFGSIKNGIIATLAGLVTILLSVALYFRGNAHKYKSDLARRNSKAADAQAEQVRRANHASEEAEKQGEQEIKNAKDKAISGGNTFNDW